MANTQRSCPGERYCISLAICRTRQRNQYPKCLLCPHRSPELAGASASDQKVSNAVFRATAVLGRVPEQVNEYVMRKIGLATAQLLRAENPSGSRLVVGCDLRENSRGFARIFCEGVNRSGLDAANLGVATPDQLAFAVGTDSYAGAAFIGGGNYADNVSGVRLWRRDGRLVAFGDGLEKVGLIARRLRMASSRLPGETSSESVLADYVPYVAKFASQFPTLRLVVGGGNGSAGRVLRPLLAKLPVELTAVRFEEDSHTPLLGRRFPCHMVVTSMKRAVRESRAGFGAAVDFTGERIAFFDEGGELLRHDVAAGLIASELLARNPEEVICFDLRSTASLRARIRALGGEAVGAPAARRGFAMAFRRSEALYGADLTGLHYFRDFFRFPSAIVALLVFGSYLAREGGKVSELAGELDVFSRSEEGNYEIPSADAAESILKRVRDEFPEAEKEMIDGLTVRTQDWWFNLRQPGKAAHLELVVEGRDRRAERRGRQTIEKLLQRAVSELAG